MKNNLGVFVHNAYNETGDVLVNNDDKTIAFLFFVGYTSFNYDGRI